MILDHRGDLFNFLSKTLHISVPLPHLPAHNSIFTVPGLIPTRSFAFEEDETVNLVNVPSQTTLLDHLCRVPLSPVAIYPEETAELVDTNVAVESRCSQKVVLQDSLVEYG